MSSNKLNSRELTWYLKLQDKSIFRSLNWIFNHIIPLDLATITEVCLLLKYSEICSYNLNLDYLIPPDSEIVLSV